MALSCNPGLLIADEPTTALDVTTQAQILELMKRLRVEHGSSIILITHDMGVVSEIADQVLVMYAGRAAEQGHTKLNGPAAPAPLHVGLLGSVPAATGREKVRRLPAIPRSPPSPFDIRAGMPLRAAPAAPVDSATSGRHSPAPCRAPRRLLAARDRRQELRLSVTAAAVAEGDIGDITGAPPRHCAGPEEAS